MEVRLSRKAEKQFNGPQAECDWPWGDRTGARAVGGDRDRSWRQAGAEVRPRRLLQGQVRTGSKPSDAELEGFWHEVTWF